MAKKMKDATVKKSFLKQKGDRGTGLKFKVETYATVSQFSPGTRIKYGPNPKQPGSKSHKRYAGYCKAKTVGEALKFGARPADFFWELERGDYKVLGSKRSDAQEIRAIGQKHFDKCKSLKFNGPNGINLKLTDPRAVEQVKQEEAWRNEKLKRVEAVAKRLRLKVETPAEVERSTESGDVRLERRVADAVSALKLKSGKKITDADVSEVLGYWGFGQNVGRLNVMPEGQKYVYSDTIGMIKQRSRGYGITPPTLRYRNFPRLLNKWLHDNMPKKVAGKFVCTAHNLNANYAGRRHRDQNNEGPSIIRAFGKFTGGRLLYWPKDLKKDGRAKVETLKKSDSVCFDLKTNTTVFDGNRAHEVEPFKGERYSIVFFTSRGHEKLSPDKVSTMKSMGFSWPTPAKMRELKHVTGV